VDAIRVRKRSENQTTEAGAGKLAKVNGRVVYMAIEFINTWIVSSSKRSKKRNENKRVGMSCFIFCREGMVVNFSQPGRIRANVLTLGVGKLPPKNANFGTLTFVT
jgi:hypothetical protein